MKAMILAAGKGERMRPLTLHTPKPLLQAGGQPLIHYHLQRLARSGFSDVTINLAWLGEQIAEALGKGDAFGLKLSYSREGEPLETAGGIVHALPMLTDAGDDWFVVINGDIWCDFDLRELKPPDDADALLVLTDNPAHNPQGDFALKPDGRISCDEILPRLTFTGVSLLNHRLFAGLTDQSGKLGPLLQKAAGANRVKGVYHGGQWLDVGTPERLSWLDRKLRAPNSRGSRNFQW